MAKQKQRTIVKPTKRAIESAARDLATTIAKYDPANVIACVLHAELAKIDPRTGFDRDVEIAKSEYVALLGLYAGAMRDDSQPRARFKWADFEDIYSRASALFDATRDYYGSAYKRANELGMSLAGLQLFVRLAGFGIRGPAPWARWRPFLITLFSNERLHLQRHLGFSINDAVAIVDAVRMNVRAKLQSHFDELTRMSIRTSDPKTVLIERSAHEDLLNAIGSCISISPADVAEWASVTLDTAYAFLSVFTIGDEDRRETLLMPSPMNVLSTRPLIASASGAALVPYYGLLPFALFPRIDALLMRSSDHENYRDIRSRFLETKALNLLTAAGFEEPMNNLSFSVPNDKGNLTEFELDGTVSYDSVRLILECKSGAIDEGARRGGEASLGESLREIAIKIDEQTTRASRYIATGKPTYRKDGTAIVLPRTSSSIRIGITLDMYCPGTAMIMASRYPLGELNGEVPWIINLVELAVVLEVLGSPAKVIHYLRRRLQPKLGNIRIQAFDEYDVLMLYTEMNLQDQFDEMQDRVATLLPLGLMPQLNAFLAGPRAADGRTPPRPSQPIPRRLKALLNLLEHSAQVNRVEAVNDILNLRFVYRFAFEEALEGCQKRALRGSIRSARVHVDSKSSILYVCEDDAIPLAFAESSLLESPGSDYVLLIAHDLIGRVVRFRWFDSTSGRLLRAIRSLSGMPLGRRDDDERGPTRL